MTGHIVATGCAGFLGSHLTDRLLSDRHTVVGLDSSIQGHVSALRLAAPRDDNGMLPKRR